VAHQFAKEVFVNEKLKVGFLVNATVRWPPAKRRVCRFASIHDGLRVDREEQVLIKQFQHVTDVI
jgi:hypothetical protein